MAVETFSSSTTWVCPASVSSVQAECYGGSGGGGEPGGGISPSGFRGGGGAAYSKKLTIPVVPGVSYTVTVGAAGQGTNSASTDGGDSWFSTSGTVLAKGGLCGNNGGTGGAAGSGVGDTKFSGGNGFSPGISTFGGGGGGGAGDAASGTNASSQTGAVGGATTGGTGGDGGNNTASGNVGGTLGGGGGGAGAGSGLNGGNGVTGRVILTYTVLTADQMCETWGNPQEQPFMREPIRVVAY